MALKALFYPDVPFDSLFIPYIFKEIYLEGVYVDIFNQKKDMVIVDVGANIGIVTHYMRQFAKKIYAIEPSTEHFEALKKNKEFNKWDNVDIFNMAIASQNGEMVLNLNSQNRTCHSLVLGTNEGGEMVKTQTFATFMKENKIDKIDFVKFDVEGAEESILMSEGFTSVADKVLAIEVEFHFPGFERIVEHMIKLGYTARRYESSAVIILFTR